MIARTALVAALLASAIVALASQAHAMSDKQGPRRETAASETSPAAKPACRVVKVVYAGHGEAERAPCRTR